MEAGTEPRNGRTWKAFTCDRCGARRLDFEVFGIGRRQFCLMPDCRPAFRVYRMYGWRPRIWWRWRFDRGYS